MSPQNKTEVKIKLLKQSIVNGSFVWLYNPLLWVGMVLSCSRDSNVRIQWFMESDVDSGMFKPTNVTFLEPIEILHPLKMRQLSTELLWHTVDL